ncbi:heterokaryon incompatibility protein-domain-containing protein [Cladorrhinum sp. PSN332]|nr:heterokaryon incompatibility protein-domain-containing protein [Cladorrhinum sp. PSN332]
MLCSYCRQISPDSTWYYHYPRLADFQVSAATCPICAMLLGLLNPAELIEITRHAAEPNHYAKVIIAGTPTKDTDDKKFLNKPIVRLVNIVTPTRYHKSQPFVLNYVGGDFSERAIWSKNEAVSYTDSFPVLESWYHECVNTSQHHRCNSEPQTLPTRLLYVGSQASPTLQLVQSAGQTGIYAALSHCWGTAQHDARTTMANFSDMLKGIQESWLPKTFSDAVQIARQLGVQHLWIDSLCIIQDDEADWQKESGAMAAVYSNAHLTLAATASKDSDGGFIFDREPAKHVVSADGDKIICYIRYPAGENRSLFQSPLYKRGWVLQEMVLSRRTVHFARDQLFWHCRSRITSEDGFFDAALGLTYSDLDSPQKAQESWWTWIEDYSNRQLTRPSDKFAALAGLTKSFPHGGKPLAGLWADDLHFGLLWCAGQGATRANLKGIPSWSWASVNGSVRALSARDSPIWQDHDANVTKHLTLLDSTVEWSGNALTSEISHASLKVEAKVALLLVAAEDSRTQDGLTGREWGGGVYENLSYHDYVKLVTLLPLITDFDNNGPVFSRGHGCLDVESETPHPGSRVLCVLVSTSCHCGRRAGNCWFYRDLESRPKKPEDELNCRHLLHNIMLIEATGRVPDEFRRIGVGTIAASVGKGDYFSDVETMEFTLV